MFLSDEEILNNIRTRGKEEFAFTQLVRKYQQKIYYTVRRMVINHDDADDITQDVFIKCWNKIGEFRGDSQIYTWLYRIAVNETINFLNQKRHKIFIPLSKSVKKAAMAEAAAESLPGDDIQKKLQLALLQLPDKQRLVFNLRYYDEMDYREMSKILGTSEGALKASYHHAVKKVEKYLMFD